MFEKNLSYIAYYLWEQSIKNINNVLSLEEIKAFNLNDYYYLTTIYFLGRPNFGELSEALKLTKPAISALVKRLLKNGLIEKVQSEEDRRVYYLTVSEKGNRIIEIDNESFSVLSDEMEKLLSKEQIAELDCLLGEIVKKVSRR